MLCDVCKCNDATVFLTQILEGKMHKVNLCEACSKEKGVRIRPVSLLLICCWASEPPKKLKKEHRLRNAPSAVLVRRTSKKQVAWVAANATRPSPRVWVRS